MNVLVGIDGTERAFAAFERTVARVKETGDDLTAAIVASEIERPETIERRVREVLDGEGIEAPIRRIEGHAGGGLVDLADDGGFDRLVVDGGERSPTGKIRLDSTTEFVLLNAETSVTLAR
ncbi:universal stress protein [Halococcus saccharolyticus]|uniref:UspA domain protein n=1 Tax=Halococcus saccharolyticus DSM 5350 TaxID=1227455 RepID=M0MBU4_9EURY|nr:universal stress protein [Halococcus saccharolyticus]EMA43247.1 UspA domain protein [Halococcus saccharolyticus DSM 5350]